MIATNPTTLPTGLKFIACMAAPEAMLRVFEKCENAVLTSLGWGAVGLHGGNQKRSALAMWRALR